MNIAVLIGGSGRSLKNFIDLGSELGADIRLVIAHKEVPGLKYAQKANIHYSCGNFSSDYVGVFEILNYYKIDLAVMAGWIKLLKVPGEWVNRIMNIHPSLLPAFGGKGMYGHHVHEAVIESGTKFTGPTVHYVDNEYDHGPIILQRMIPVLDTDTPQKLAARVFEEEKIIYPQAIQLHARNKLIVRGRRVKIKD